MDAVNPDQFLGLPPAGLEQADAVILPLPLEKTVSYGTGTWRAPRAILDASCQIELFDEETLVDFAEAPKLHTLPLLLAEGTVQDYLQAAAKQAEALRGKFVVALGGEHTVSYGVVTGLVEDPSQLTIVQIDAHADLIVEFDGQRWCHGTVMRRLHEQGAEIIQIGVRSLSRAEYEFAASTPRITTWYAHRLAAQWPELMNSLAAISGDVYLSIDVDGLDPAVIPSTGTPQPNGLSWSQTMEIMRTLSGGKESRLIGADVVELVASPHPPGCDLTAAKLAAKVLAWWAVGRT